MKYFIDTEFIEHPHDRTIDLISLGMVSEDGKTLYAECTEFDETKASPWVKENVISQLRWCRDSDRKRWLHTFTKDSGNVRVVGPSTLIRNAIIEFVQPNPEFWGYYSSYDFVLFSWLFGTMVDLPKGWPMFCFDLRQWLNHKGLSDIKQPDDMPHNALSDAVWVYETWKKYDAT